MISDKFIRSMMVALRVKSENAMMEINDLAEACVIDLRIAGCKTIEDINDPMVRQAIKLYCKANYGYDESEETEKYRRAYMALRDSMALSSDYGGDADE